MKKLILFFLLCALLSTAALALDTEGLSDAMPDSAQEILGDAGVRDAGRSKELFLSLKDWLQVHLAEEAKSARAQTAASRSLSTDFIIPSPPFRRRRAPGGKRIRCGPGC